MSFLRSIIADAHPSRPLHGHSDSPSAITGWKTRGFDGDASGGEDKSPGAPDQTNHLTTSLPVRESASNFKTGDSSSFQADNPVNLDIQDMGSIAESGNPFSEPVDKSVPILDQESTQHLASDHEETEAISSPANIRGMSGKEFTDYEDNSSLQAEEGAGQLGVHETMSSAADGDTPAQGAIVGVTAADERRNSESSIKATETLTTQADVTQTTALTSTRSGQRIESNVLDVSLVSSFPAPDASGTPTPGIPAAAVSHVTGVNVDLQDSGELRVDDTSGSLSGQAPTPDNSDGRNETEKASAESGKTRQISQGVSKQADMKSLTNQEDIHRLQKLGELNGVHHDVQTVSQQAMAMASQGPSDMGHASVLQSADKKVPASASSHDPVLSKPGSPEPHIARPARPSESPESLRTAQATPFQTDSMPNAGGTFHSRPPHRTPEKKHEAPKVQIGQIDVIIEAAAQPVSKQALAPSAIDLASRHYLRRL